jgi:hypothetical protein
MLQNVKLVNLCKRYPGIRYLIIRYLTSPFSNKRFQGRGMKLSPLFLLSKEVYNELLYIWIINIYKTKVSLSNYSVLIHRTEEHINLQNREMLV